MAVYKFKCSGCGATQCEKEDNGYRCVYCGNVQDVIFPDEKNYEENNNQKIQEPEHVDYSITSVNKETRFLIIKLLICFFVGYLGVHKFMEGRILSGIIYIFTGGLFGIGILVDVIKYISQLVRAEK